MAGYLDNLPFVAPTTRDELYAVGFTAQPDFEKHARAILTIGNEVECRLFHGLIDPGDPPGYRIPFAWLEQQMVYGDDLEICVVHLLGKTGDLTMPAALFRRLARVLVEPGYIASYAREEVASKVFSLKNYGPWGLKSGSG